MFTGIVERAGKVAGVEVKGDGARLVISAGPIAAEARIGDSVAVNGVCLTVAACGGDRVEFDAVHETLRRSSLGSLRAGDRVNLERPLRADGRFDGHIVQGHVDGVARVESVSVDGNSRRLRFGADAGILRYVVEKGSITLDGVSLTVTGVAEDWFEVVVIPHTREVTTLGELTVGDPVNLEIDVIAKYVDKLVGAFK